MAFEGRLFICIYHDLGLSQSFGLPGRVCWKGRNNRNVWYRNKTWSSVWEWLFFFFLWLSLLPLCTVWASFCRLKSRNVFYVLCARRGGAELHRVLEFEMFCLLMATVSQLRWWYDIFCWSLCTSLNISEMFSIYPQEPKKKVKSLKVAAEDLNAVARQCVVCVLYLKICHKVSVILRFPSSISVQLNMTNCE